MATGGLPGPHTLATLGMCSVPNASAATPAGPFTRNTWSMPSMRAVTSTAGSTSPPVPGTGGTTTATCPTPATLAGVPIWPSTDGKLPLPLGTNRPADTMGVIFSPAVRPGSISIDQSCCVRQDALVEPADVVDEVGDGRLHRLGHRVSAAANSSGVTAGGRG